MPPANRARPADVSSASAVTTSWYSGSPGRSGLLRAVEHGDAADRLGERGDERLGREGPEQPDLHEPDALAAFRSIASTASSAAPAPDPIMHQHALGLGMPDVVEEPVGAPGARRQPVHRGLHGVGHRRVERVAGLARLEEDVGVLRRAAQPRMLGRERPSPMLVDEPIVDHRAQVLVEESPRSCRPRATCGTRRRSGGTGRGTRVSPRERRARDPAPPAPTTTRASRTPSCGRPSRRSGRRRSRARGWRSCAPRRASRTGSARPRS